MLLHTVCLATETLIRNYVRAVFHFTNDIRLLAYHQSNMGVMVITIDGTEFCVLKNEHAEMHRLLQTVLNTFGRTDGVCVTTQTKQHVLHDIRELLERLEHE